MRWTSRLAPAAGAACTCPAGSPATIAVLDRAHLGADWRDHQDDEPWWTAAIAIPGRRSVGRAAAAARLPGRFHARARAPALDARAASGAQLVAPGHAARSRGADDRRSRGGSATTAPPTSIFHDAERLAAILTARRRPVQIVFAGRAHAGDEAAKRHLQRLFTRALDPMFGGRDRLPRGLRPARGPAAGRRAAIVAQHAGGRPARPLGALQGAVNGVPPLQSSRRPRTPRRARLLQPPRGGHRPRLLPPRSRRGAASTGSPACARPSRTAIPRLTARRGRQGAAERLYNPALRHV